MGARDGRFISVSGPRSLSPSISELYPLFLRTPEIGRRASHVRRWIPGTPELQGLCEQPSAEQVVGEHKVVRLTIVRQGSPGEGAG
jgi:hypothetical protein